MSNQCVRFSDCSIEKELKGAGLKIGRLQSGCWEHSGETQLLAHEC